MEWSLLNLGNVSILDVPFQLIVMPDNDLMRCRFVERLYGCGMSLMFMVGVGGLEPPRD